MVTGRRVCEYHRLLFHIHLLIIFFSKHRIWILFSLFCFFCLFFFFLCLFFLPLLFSFFFLLFFKFVFLFFFFFSSSFFIISKVALLRAGPELEELLFPGLGDALRFSFVPCVFSVVFFKYSVKLSSVCVDLLQVPGFTALAYV